MVTAGPSTLHGSAVTRFDVGILPTTSRAAPWGASPPDRHTNRQRETAISTLRPFAAQDLDAILALSIRAWEPVFGSLEQVLGAEIFLAMHRDWRADQRRTVHHACSSDDVAVWVAEAEQALVGFVGIRTDEPTGLGEIYIIAVDPAHQRSGVATALMRLALDQLADAGMSVAMVETGGDAGHAPARELYRHLGFTLLPIARYFKKL